MKTTELKHIGLHLSKKFDLFEGGESHGRFEVVGPGTDCRLAEEYDDARFYDHQRNAMDTVGDTFVMTSPNDFTRKGVVFVDTDSRHERRGNKALMSKLEMMQSIAASFVYISSQSNHELGAITSKVIRPGTHRDRVAGSINQEKTDGSSPTFTDKLQIALRSANSLQFVVIVSDFRTPGWEDAVRKLSLKCEVILIEVTDTWDFAIPDAGEINLFYPGQGNKLVNTSSRRTRKAYAKAAQQINDDLLSTIQELKVRHLQVSNSEDWIEEVKRILAPTNN